MDQRKNQKHSRGQILVLVAILIPVLIIFVGFAVDFGLAYVTKTTLSKSVDAAALAASFQRLLMAMEARRGQTDTTSPQLEPVE